MSCRSDTNVQTKNVIYNVYIYFKTLAKNIDEPDVAKHFRQTQNVTAKACGVSLATVRRVCAEGQKFTRFDHEPEDRPLFKSPRQSYKRQKSIIDLDDFGKDVVRRTVHNFYENREFPTSAKILDAVREKIDFKGSKSSMEIILRNLQFKFKKCKDGRKFLMERNDIVTARVEFLKKMSELRRNNDPRPVVYLDETCVCPNDTRGYLWKNPSDTEDLRIPIGKGDRNIVCHAGSSKFGFVKNSKLVLHSKPIDYDSQMNPLVFEMWFVKMLHNLEMPCVIVMDNASYHSKLVKDHPISNVTNTDIQTMNELQERVKLLVPKEKKYKLDEIASRMGHEVIRLPPYHSQYNPIELIWTQVKSHVMQTNLTLKMADLEVLLNNALDAITIEDWKKYDDYCIKIQEEDLVKEELRDKFIKSIISQ